MHLPIAIDAYLHRYVWIILYVWAIIPISNNNMIYNRVWLFVFLLFYHFFMWNFSRCIFCLSFSFLLHHLLLSYYFFHFSSQFLLCLLLLFFVFFFISSLQLEQTCTFFHLDIFSLFYPSSTFCLWPLSPVFSLVPHDDYVCFT